MPNVEYAFEAFKLLQSWSLWLLGIHTAAIGFLSVMYIRGGRMPRTKAASATVILAYVCFGCSIIAADFVQGGLPAVASQLVFLDDASQIPSHNVFAFPFPPNWRTPLYLWAHLQTMFVFLGIVLFAVSVLIHVSSRNHVVDRPQGAAEG